MAAAIDLGAFGVTTRVKHSARERAQRGPRAGAFGKSYESREASEKRDREAGKLDEHERGELLFLWSGFDAALGVRSVQGAVEDRLLRSPPRVGADLERQVEVELARRGKAGAVRDRLVEVLALENAATRHEARLALRRMVGAGRIEYFVAPEQRRRACSCKVGAADGTRRQKGGCVCGSGEPETVPREMARLVFEKSRAIPGAVPPAERWARADRELEAYCQMIACGESSFAPGSRLPPQVQSSRADAARSALRALPAEHRRVIERAYGSGIHTWAGLSLEASRLAVFCPAVERARRELVDLEVTGRNPGSVPGPEARRSADRGVAASDALRAKLDRVPEGELERARWKVEREAFVRAVEREATGMLFEAVRRYRTARGA